jgi:hypothetical protein
MSRCQKSKKDKSYDVDTKSIDIGDIDTYNIDEGEYLYGDKDEEGQVIRYNDYYYFEHGEKKHPLHMLVAKTFIENKDPTKTHVIHINGDISDNSSKNLKWVTAEEFNKSKFATLDKESFMATYNGYEYLHHGDKKYLMCKLIATKHVKNNDPTKTHVLHINGKTTDDRSFNLKWVTREEFIMNRNKRKINNKKKRNKRNIKNSQ